MKEMRTKRHLAILRTNRQIYNEASTLLHSNLTIVVRPDNVVTDKSGNAIVKSGKKVWRHARSPVNLNGQLAYEIPPLDDSLQPHVFARFERICYSGEFDLQFDNPASRLYVDDDFSVRAADADKLLSHLNTSKSTTRWSEDPLPDGRYDNGLRETPEDVADITTPSTIVAKPSIVACTIQRLIDVLSSSLFVRHLEFALDVGVGCSSLSGYTDSFDDEDPEQEAKDFEKIGVANQRATELILESGVLNSLRSLSNVKTFTLTVDTVGRGDKVMKLGKKDLEIIGDLKEAVEKNWAVKHGTQ